MNINCKIKLAPGAKLPTRAHDTDTGYDVYAKDIYIALKNGYTYNMKEEEDTTYLFPSMFTINNPIQYIVIDTGVSIAPPAGYACIAAAQSRVAKSGWTIANGIGVIDNGYRGTIKFVYEPEKNAIPDLDLFAIGKKCGQLIFHKVETATFEQVDELPDTDRGTGGFGSTGNS